MELIAKLFQQHHSKAATILEGNNTEDNNMEDNMDLRGNSRFTFSKVRKVVVKALPVAWDAAPRVAVSFS